MSIDEVHKEEKRSQWESEVENETTKNANITS